MYPDRKKLSDKDRMSFQSDEFYFKSIDEMANAFSQYPEALKNTLKIAEMCNVDITTGVYHFPDFRTSDNLNINEYLEKNVKKVFKEN